MRAPAEPSADEPRVSAPRGGGRLLALPAILLPPLLGWLLPPDAAALLLPLTLIPLVVAAWLRGAVTGLLVSLLAVAGLLLGPAPAAIARLDGHGSGPALLLALAGIAIGMLAGRARLALPRHNRPYDTLTLQAHLIDSTDDAVTASDSQAIITHWNHGAEKLFGYRADEIIGHSARILIPPSLQPMEQAVLARAAAGEHVPPYRTQRLHKDGTAVDITTTVSAIRDRRGKVIGISRISTDIGEQLRSEQARQDVEARFRALVEQSLTGAFIVQGNRMVYANQALADLFGYPSAAALMAEPASRLVAAESRPRLLAQQRRLFAGKTETLRLGFAGNRQDGSRVMVEVYGRRFCHEGQPAVIGSVVDITATEQRHAALAQQVAQQTALLRRHEQELHTILDSMPALISYYAPDLSHRFGNQAYCRWHGVEQARLAGLPLKQLLCPAQYQTLQPRLSLALQGKPQMFEHRMQALDDTRNWDAQIQLIPDRQGERVTGVFALILDISPLKQAEAALRESEERFRLLFEAAPVGISLYHSNGQCLMANQAQADLVGGTQAQLLAQNFRKLDSWRRSGLLSIAEKALQTGLKQHYELQMESTFGRNLEIECEFTLLEVGGVCYLMLLAKDITPFRQAARLMKQAMDAELDKARLDHRYRQVVENMADGFFSADMDGRILEVNDVFARLSGYSRAELIGMNASELESDITQDDIRARFHRIAEQGSVRLETWQRRRDGMTWPCDISASFSAGEGGKIYVFARDITEMKRAEDEIRRLAFYDSLTRLPNRQLLLDRLQQALIGCRRNHRHAALLFIDLDNFKQLNDTLGHDMGDRLLVNVAKRLRSCVRSRDTVARLGGDEFIILLEDLAAQREAATDQIRRVADKVMEALNHPYPLGGIEHHSTPSIGIALFNEHDHTSVEEQLKHADLAMYQAKAAGRNTVCFFDPVSQAQLESRSTLESELRTALRDDHLLLYYQPQVDRNGRIVGAEALVRWQHPLQGLIEPGEFIGLAEETGLVHPLGLRVLEIACDRLADWRGQPGFDQLTLAVNVSARQFRHQGFVQQIRSLVERRGIDPSRLKLELTESLLLHDIEETASRMESLRAIGVRFSLDDFGTGYSSLAYLKSLPLEQLKIDRSFVRDLLTDPNDAAIVRAIIVMGHSLGLAIVAEGVETPEQWRMLLREGCDIGQGYHFSLPLPESGLTALAGHALPVA